MGTVNTIDACISRPSAAVILTHCGLVTLYGGKDLGQHWFRYWLVAWLHQAITWTSLDLSLVKSSDIRLMLTSLEIPQPSTTECCLKITYLKSQSNLPGTNELIWYLADSSLLQGCYLCFSAFGNIKCKCTFNIEFNQHLTGQDMYCWHFIMYGQWMLT